MKTTPEMSGSPRAEDTQREQRRLERRRLLVKGISKGSAVVVAGTPLQSLATSQVLTGNKMLCTASGMQSAVRSQTTGAVTCSGWGHTKYQTKSNWPGYNSTTSQASFTVGTKTVSTLSSCTYLSVFGTGTNSSLMSILNGAGTSAERVWLTALLNSEHHRRTPSLGLNFPYAPAEIFTLMSGSQAASALTLFETHLMQKP